MDEHAVVIAGGGPTGMVLGAELALAGTEVVIVERRASTDLDGSRAGGLHARTLELLDQRGIADRFLAAGLAVQVAGFAGIPLDIGDLPSRFPHGLALWQPEIERLLAGWVEELGVPIRREREVVGVHQDADGVDVALSDGTTLRARYLVGCDGGRSTVRKAAGIAFTGTDPTTSWLIAEAEMAEEPPVGMRPEGGGIGPVTRGEGAGGGRYRVVLVERPAVTGPMPTSADLSAALVRAYGTDFGVHSPSWVSRFSDATRQAETHRAGRVLVAGDAAHIHPPQGGQGLNVGVQDSVNLGWKLAQVAAGTSPDGLLDTYHDERHPVAARVIETTLAQVALGEQDSHHAALREIIADVLALPEARRRVGAMMSALDVHHDLGDGHPLLGRRMPDLDLVTAEGPTRIAALLHEARPLLVRLGATPRDATAAPPTTDHPRIRCVDATTDGPWELPVVGPVAVPSAVLVRPDGHVAWVGEDADQADEGDDASTLTAAVARWFGAA